MKLNWSTIIATISALAGVAGTVLTPIYGSGLSSAVQGVLMGLSAILVAITGYHATSIVASDAKALHAADREALARGTTALR